MNKNNVTIGSLAEAMDVSSRTVNNYLKRGMPRDSIQSAKDWRAQNISDTPGPDPDPEQADVKASLLRAELRDKTESARTRKIKNDILEGQLIERLEVERDIAIAISRITNKLNALGTRCANLCPSELKPAIKEAVEDTVRLSLRELADDLLERDTDNA